MTNNTKVKLTDLFYLRDEVRNKMSNKDDETIKGLVKELENELNAENEYILEEKFFALNTLAKYFRKVKNYDKSANYSRQAINISKNISSEYMKVIIDTYLDYAELEREYGNYSNARIELAKLLALLDKSEFYDHFASGLIYYSLGNISLAEENMEGGLIQLERALVNFQKATHKRHPIIAQTIGVLTEAYIKVENYNKALELYQWLSDAYKQANDNLSEARYLLKVGEVYFYIDLKEARRTTTNAIKLLEGIHNEKHLDIAKANLMLAEVDENIGNYPRSITYYKRGLEQLESFYPENHFMIVYVYSKIGTISIKSNELGQAKQYLEKGLTLSGSFPKIKLQFLYALGKIYSGEKQYDRAFNMFHEFLQRLEEDGRKDQVAYGNTLQAIAFNYLEQDKFEGAFDYYEKAKAIYEKLSNCREELGLTLIRLAYCFENKKKQDIEQAEKYYEKGFNLIEKIHEPGLLEEALAGIIDFYTRNKNAKKRRFYEDKFVELQKER